MRTIIALPALVTALGLTIPALADVQPAAMQKIVRYRDLDLSKPADRKKMEFRVRHAARVVCNGVDIRNVPTYSEDLECYDRAISGARAQLANRGIELQLASR